MGNMSYCRFENTVRDLRDCLEAIENGEMTNLGDGRENDALEDLLSLANDIVACRDEIEDAIDYNKDNEYILK
jgi:hypothetical protein|tara:strand:- start:1 stop:219 length:219 start_codon:yes stop_codon:yes gene_type:complete